ICALLEGGIWWLLRTEFARRHGQALGLTVALLPVFFICWMIYMTEGAESSYYAGLNLILLAIALVMRWSVGLSGIALTLTVAMYLAACSPHGNVEWDGTRVFVHLYFIGLTGIIVVTGSRIHHQLRIKEFALTQELEQSNQKLKELDQLKSRFFANISHE